MRARISFFFSGERPATISLNLAILSDSINTSSPNN
jgi:hypothetical protein